jgi:hypothetical protein
VRWISALWSSSMILPLGDCLEYWKWSWVQFPMRPNFLELITFSFSNTKFFKRVPISAYSENNNPKEESSNQAWAPKGGIMQLDHQGNKKRTTSSPTRSSARSFPSSLDRWGQHVTLVKQTSRGTWGSEERSSSHYFPNTILIKTGGNISKFSNFWANGDLSVQIELEKRAQAREGPLCNSSAFGISLP